MSEPPLASLQGQYAGFASRLLAFLVDAAMLSLVGMVSAWAAFELLTFLGIDLRECETLSGTRPVAHWLCDVFPELASWASTAFVIAYTLFFWSITGQTPGKAALGVRVVRLDGRPMGLVAAVRRLLGYAVSTFLAGLGFLFILADDRRQGWHDKLAGTCVIYAWEARENRKTVARLRRWLGG